MKRYLFAILIVLSTLGFSNNGIYIHEIKFKTGVTKISHLVIKQASKIYNKLHEKNFAKIKITGENEENFSRNNIIQLAKKKIKKFKRLFYWNRL